MDLGIKDKCVLVTAASKGIGKAVAEGFAAEGCNVIICSRDEESLIKTSEEINNKYDINVAWKVCDINNNDEIKAVVEHVENLFGSVEILVNNCGGPAPGFFEDLSEEQWNYAYHQVLLSAVRFCHLVIPKMQEKKWGRIINITSVSVKQPIDNLILSNTFRLGLTGMSKTLSTQYAKDNITINNVAPGFTLTDRIKQLAGERAKALNKSLEEVLEDMAKETPKLRMAMPEEIASAVVFLASEQAGYITGNTIHVDGGSTKGVF